MKILAIRIKNLASLEGLHEIDFTQEPLLSSGIFAITGPTGAGKSTILDALCLALYAKTPRYFQAKENGVSLKDVDGSEINQGDARAILRDGTAEGYAEVDFIGKDKKKYRSKWSTYRAGRKSTGRLQSYSIELIEIETQQNLTTKIKETQEKIAELIGLNFEQFTRSVLLAQGEFTAFLKAEKEQKASLLEKLTGTEIYSKISREVFNNYSAQKAVLKELQDRANFIQLLSPEQVEVTQNQLNETSITLKDCKLLQKKLEEKLVAFQQLRILDERITHLQQSYEDALSDKKNAQERQAKIQLIETLLPVQNHVRDENKFQKEIQELNANLSISAASFSSTATEIQQLKAGFENIKAQLEQHTSAFIQAQPLIEQARKLDVLIQEKSTLKDKQFHEIQSVEVQLSEQLDKIRKIQQQAELTQNELSQIHQWLANHQSRETIAVNQNLILSKLNDAARWVNEIQNRQQEIDDSAQKTEKDTVLIEQQKVELSAKSAQSGTLQKEIFSLEETLRLLSIEQLTQEQKKLHTQKTELFQIQKTWSDWSKILAQLTGLSQESEMIQQQLSLQQEQLSTLEAQIHTDTIILKNTEKLVEKIRMETSENVEKLRAQLTPEQPCPVCGSTEHPYAENHPAEKSALNILEKELQSLKNSFQEKQQHITRLSTSIAQYQKQLIHTEENISKNQSDADALKSIWQNFSLVKNQSSSEQTDTEKWINGSLNDLEQTLETIESSIEEHRKLSESAAILRTEWFRVKNQIDLLKSALSETEKTHLSNQERRTGLLKAQEQSAVQLEELRLYLQQYFNQPDWFDNWKNAPDIFTERIRKFSEEWNRKKENLEQLQQQIREMESELSNQKNLLEILQSSLQVKKNEHETTVKAIQLLENERKRIFEGQAAQAVESNFKLQIDQAQTELNAHSEVLQYKEKQLAVINTSIQHTTDSLTKTQNLSEQIKQDIYQWLSQKQLSYSIPELSQILNFSQEWLTQEKRYLTQIEDRCKSGFSLLNEAQKNRQEHLDSQMWDMEEPDIILQKSSLETQISELEQSQFRLTHTLESDRTEKKNKEHLLTKIARQEAIVYQWSSLNELIGSADGKKFKQLAQEYTLDILVDYSNVHLHSLSKRYLLERIPDTLALQVKDLDMGEEIRSVYSLSGGESFLVSLALALGLASLSSNKMRVESLFIDEGFGSLDPHTLNIAMDALENLYQQGRKVGVISHVQEMTERIPVQIQVSRLQTGRSTIAVKG